MLAKDRVVVSKLWITDYWLWSRLVLYSDCCKSMNNCEIELLATVGGKQGCQPAFQLPMLAKCDALPERDLCDMFVAGIHSHHHHSFWNSKHPLYQKLEVPESCSTLHQFWIISSSPSLCCTCRKNQSYAKNWTIAKIELLATVGWKQGCQPAFQLKMLAKCDALPKRDLCIFMRHVCLRNPCFCGNLTLHSTRSLRSLRAAARSTNSLWLHHACKR